VFRILLLVFCVLKFSVVTVVVSLCASWLNMHQGAILSNDVTTVQRSIMVLVLLSSTSWAKPSYINIKKYGVQINYECRLLLILIFVTSNACIKIL
jgi:hypothetical protein